MQLCALLLIYYLTIVKRKGMVFIRLSHLFAKQMADIYFLVFHFCLSPLLFILSFFLSFLATAGSLSREKINLQGQQQLASAKAVFLTVHDIGSNREWKNFALLTCLSCLLNSSFPPNSLHFLFVLFSFRAQME